MLYTAAVAPNTLGLLTELMQKPYLQGFNLVGGTSLSLQIYGFSYPKILENIIRLVNIKDIAPMKLDAISGRGKKKDFFDLYFLLRLFSLPELLALYQAKYQHTTIFHVIKSINYFEDAEEENDPVVFDKKVTWAKVKKTIIKEIQKL